jgi:hypothetical protein
VTAPRPVLATIIDLAGIVLGTFLTTAGALAIVIAISDRDVRGLLGVAPSVAGAMILIAATRDHRRTGAFRPPLLGRAGRALVSAAVTGAAILVTLYITFMVLGSDLLLVMSPEWQATAPPRQSTWLELAGSSLVGGGMLTFATLTGVLAWNMRLLPIVTTVSGAVLATLSAVFIFTVAVWPPALLLLTAGVGLVLAPRLRRRPALKAQP